LLDLCVTPRPLNARGGYQELWGSHRFERLGDMLFVPAEHSLHVRSDGAGPQGSIICALHGDEIESWLKTRIDWTDQRLHACLDISSIAIRHLLRRLANEVRNPGFGGRLLAEFLVGQLIIEMGRYCEAIGDRPMSGGLASWRLRLIDERLKAEESPPSLSELAELCRISVRQLTRGFRASRDCSIRDYVIHSRIETAKRMLESDISIKAVARTMGFSSSSSFANAFQRATGVLPSQFRQRITKAKLKTERVRT
jgi:AraC family transcriptional regulator